MPDETQKMRELDEFIDIVVNKIHDNPALAPKNVGMALVLDFPDGVRNFLTLTPDEFAQILEHVAVQRAKTYLKAHL